MRMLRGCSTWGPCPQTPGSYRIVARMTSGGGWRRLRLEFLHFRLIIWVDILVQVCFINNDET